MAETTRSDPTADLEPDPDAGGRAIWVRRAFLSLLAIIVVAGVFEFFGVRSRTVTARSADGSAELSVRYAEVARAGLDVPFEVTVHREGGFDGDVVLSLSNDYLALFDRNAMDPEPSAATSTHDATIWTFDAPPGDTFTLSFDMQVQSSRHWGRSGELDLLDASGATEARATFKTWLAP
jgi:hypothetical protein